MDVKNPDLMGLALGYGLFLYLFVIMLVAWIINKVAKRPVVNGGAIFLILAVALGAYTLFQAHDYGAYGMGKIVGYYLLPMIAAAYFAFRFRAAKEVGSSVENRLSGGRKDAPTL